MNTKKETRGYRKDTLHQTLLFMLNTHPRKIEIKERVTRDNNKELVRTSKEELKKQWLKQDFYHMNKIKGEQGKKDIKRKEELKKKIGELTYINFEKRYEERTKFDEWHVGKELNKEWTLKAVRSEKYYNQDLMPGAFVKLGLKCLEGFFPSRISEALKKLEEMGFIEKISLQPSHGKKTSGEIWRVKTNYKAYWAITKFFKESELFEEYYLSDYFAAVNRPDNLGMMSEGLKKKAPKLFKLTSKEISYSFPGDEDLIVEICLDEEFDLDEYIEKMETSGIRWKKALEILPEIYYTFNKTKHKTPNFEFED